jgi:tetratricopeptide (TPR) repeat protein
MRTLLQEGRFGDVVTELHRFEGRTVPADALLMAATAATRLGDLSLGISSASAALTRFHARADIDGRMRSLNLLGVIAYERGELDQAEAHFNESLQLARELDDNLMIARTSNNLASLIYLRNDTNGALTLFRTALLSYQRMGDRRGMAESYHNLGIVFREMDQAADAAAAAAQAVRHAELVGEASLLALAITGRAEIMLAAGELSLAGQELTWAERLATEAEDELGLVEAGRVRALLFLASGKFDRAAEVSGAARKSAEVLKAELLEAECTAVEARALRSSGKIQEAGERYADAIRLFQQQGAIRRREEFERVWQLN